MDPVIIVGVISAVVSVLSLLGNLYIARQNMKSTERKIKLEAIASIQKEQYQKFTEFEKQAELLRIRCWGVKGWTDNYGKAYSEIPVTDYRELVKGLIEQGKNFQSEWASIKGELPGPVEIYIRRLWHDCYNRISSIELRAANLVNHIEEQQSKATKKKISKAASPASTNKVIIQDCEAVSKALKSLLETLDELISISKSIRQTSNDVSHK
jgi:hypothetical protein